MAAILFSKVVANLPGTLTPDTVYLVRSGAGFDLYCTDSTGAIAHQLNAPPELSPAGLRGRGVIVPMYVYPHNGTSWVGEWQYLFDVSGRYGDSIDVLVVINPSSGPGTVVDVAYQRAIDRLLGAKALPLGYVTTGYGVTPLEQIQSGIDTWLALYPDIRGFFFDEVSTDLAHQASMAQAVAYARNKLLGAICFGNPGAWVDQSIQNLFDICCTYEDALWPSEPDMDWPDSPLETPNNIACIAHQVPSVDWSQLQMMARYWRWLFISRTGDFSSFDLLGLVSAAQAAVKRFPDDMGLRRASTPRIVGDVAGTALSTLALTAARQYFRPFSVTRPVLLSGLRISVTTAAAGTASVGIYSNATEASGDDVPGKLIVASKGLNTGATGDKSDTFPNPILLYPDTTYWASVISSAAATLRAIAVGSIKTALGRTPNNTTAISYLYAAGSGSTLPATAPTTLTNGTGNCPAIYLLE